MNTARPVTSNQTEINDKLIANFDKHRKSKFLKKASKHNIIAFEQAKTFIEKFPEKPIILDNGCGTGLSSLKLARTYSDSIIIAIDKSLARLRKFPHYLGLEGGATPENLLFIRADAEEIWRLFKQEGIRTDKAFFFYPNPWPKKNDFKKRWYSHPAFAETIDIFGELYVRSNWKLFCEEFAQVANHFYSDQYSVEELEIERKVYFTAFEKKYYESGQTLWEMKKHK